MENKEYIIRYLPIFSEDLNKIMNYISKDLNNPLAARNLLNRIELYINNIAYNPTVFEEYHSKKERENPYYRVYVGNYVLYYVVIGNVIEFRRIIYKN